jgi:hypothetical protein
LPSANGHNVPRLIDKLVPGFAAMVDDVFVGCEDAVGKPVVAQELPDILDRVQFGAFGRQRDDADILGHFEFVGHMPASLIHQQHGVGTGRDGERYFGQMERHGLGVAEGQDQTGAFAVFRADGAKDIGGFRSLILGSRWPRAALGPAARDLVFLADAGFVRKPDFYGRAARKGGFDRCQRGSEAFFLKSSIANSFWAWCRGRAVSLT